MNIINTVKSIILQLVFLCVCLLFSNHVKAQFHNIKNDIFWDTKDGKPIYSQGGGIFTFKDPSAGVEKYYWYGVHYKGAELYRENPAITQERTNFLDVSCYTSTDLVNWTMEEPVLTRAEIDENFPRTGWVGRLGVAYVKELKKYAMFVQHNDQVLITVADKPTGPFKWHQRISMKETIGTSNTGDQTVFTDEDTGISYLVYSYGQGRNKIYISEIGVKNGKVDLLDCTQVFKGRGREGNCMFKYQGKYYLYASNLYGWDSSYAYYLVADDIRGPYTPTNKMLITQGSMEDYAHITQTGFFVNVKGSKQETVVYCGDRWADFAGNGLGYNQWCPLSFEGEVPYFNSLNSWKLNESTGEWKVASDNNYVKNPSFEADRRHIPSPVKPIKEQLLAWHSKVLEGNVIVVADKDTPVLNYFNTEADRKHVIGEKSLNITDAISFKRKVFQIIESSPYVKLKDGKYHLTAKIKSSGTFQKLEMYAESGVDKKTHPINTHKNQWKTVEIKNVPVVNGKVEIGFVVYGDAEAHCWVDDVSFVNAQN
ncbi:family 43 glycosylhydrolase [Wenyingzhuangia sp. chi5]|uniref:Family 43 glycosylhydrolase n=1 Tax=Wenyingzhuangia gilva TaxID=3057677 RepID=A0ABT8VUE0_9FLAO|nr:family 43 glycosylhydrolase [Wenyingzhuangia sp. chi5]MDO3695599.1 family 43 glycosylhydrolase [Wenyingzhuangia sp. chi5]